MNLSKLGVMGREEGLGMELKSTYIASQGEEKIIYVMGVKKISKH